jgi:hypothetical protein
VADWDNGEVQSRAYACGLIATALIAPEFVKPENLNLSAEEDTAIRRYEFAQLHMFALNHISVERHRVAHMIADLGSPSENHYRVPYNAINVYQLEEVYRRANVIPDGFPTRFPHLEWPSIFDPISIDDLNDGFDVASQLHAMKRSDRKKLTLLFESIVHFTRCAWDIAFILCWASSEACINSLFEDEVVSQRSEKKEREKLRDGRSFTASVMLEMLVEKGVIEREAYDVLDKARGARNKFIHKLTAVDPRLLADLIFQTASLVGKTTGFQPIFTLMRPGLR